MTEQKPGGLNQFPFKKGLYTVTKVFCTQTDCLNRTECHDAEGACAEIGLQENDPGCYMICHEYNNQLMPACIESDKKKVYWARKYPYV